MAEFVRIWDEATQDYIEYDTTVVLFETVSVPVTPVSISRDINTGIVQKIIDTNEIIVGTQSVEISQIFRPVIVEKSDANRLSIQTSLAKQINVDAVRSEIIINSSSIGRKGDKGEKGDPAVTVFDPNRLYVTGDIVVFGDESWVARGTVDGRLMLLEDPVEGSLWTRITNQVILDAANAILTSGYEITNQASWNAIESELILGDIVRVANNLEGGDSSITVLQFAQTEPLEIGAVGTPIETDSGLQFFTVVTDTVNGTMRMEATNSSDFTLEEFIDAIGGESALGTKRFFQGNDVGSSSPIEYTIKDAVLFRTFPTAQVLVSFESVTGGSATPLAATLVDGFDAQTRLFEGNPNGIQINERVTDLVVGDRIYVVGDREATLQTILRVVNAPNITYYDIQNYSGYTAGGFIIGEVISQQTLSSGQWYARNENVAASLDKLDALATDVELRNTVADLSNKVGTDPGILSATDKLAVETFFASNPQPYSVEKDRRNTLAVKRILGSSVNSDGDIPTGLQLSLATSSRYIGIQDGAQQNYIDNVIEDSTNLVTETTTETINNITREVRTLKSNAERNKIDSAIGVLDINASRILSSTAEVNVVNSVDVDPGSILSLDSDRQLSATESTSTGGTGEGNKLILLNSEGVIPSTAITQVNLSNITIFLTLDGRNSNTDKAWSTGDTAIVAGIPGLFLATDPFIVGGTTLKLDSTDDLPNSGQINLRFGDNFKRVNFTNNDTATDTLTVAIDTFVDGDVVKFPSGELGTAITTATGTFVYLSSDQTAGTPPATIGQVTTNADWAEIVPTGGVATSINGASGVVTLGVANVNGLETALGTKVDKDGTNRLGTTDEFNQITTNETSIGRVDRIATQEDVDNGDAVNVGDNIPGIGLEKNLADEVIARSDADTDIIGSAGAIDSGTGLRSGNTGYTGADATLQDNINTETTTRSSADTILQGNINNKQDDLTDGLTTDQVLKWNTDSDTWEPGNVEFAEYSSAKTYSRKDIVTINGRVALGDTLRLIINVSPDSAFDQLRLTDGGATIIQSFSNDTGNLTDADGSITLAAGTPGAIPSGVAGAGQIRIFPNQTPEAMASDLASILPHSFSIRNLTTYTVNYFGGNTIYITKSDDIGTLGATTTGANTWEVTWDVFNERGIDSSIWFAKVGSFDVTPGTNSSFWRQIDNKDEVSEYDSSRIYSVKEVVTTGRVGLGEVIRLRINASHTANGQQLSLAESTVGGRFIQIFGNFANNLIDADGNTGVSLAAGTPGVIVGTTGQIRVFANQTPEATAADIALILPRSFEIRGITNFTVHYFGGNEVYISKVGDIGTLTTVTENETWDTTFDNFDEPGTDVNTFISLRDNNSVTPGTNRDAWGKLNTVNDDGDIELLDNEAGIILRSTLGNRFKITVADDGTITSTSVT